MRITECYVNKTASFFNQILLLVSMSMPSTQKVVSVHCYNNSAYTGIVGRVNAKLMGLIMFFIDFNAPIFALRHMISYLCLLICD